MRDGKSGRAGHRLMWLLLVLILGVMASVTAGARQTASAEDAVSLGYKTRRPHCGLYCLYIVMKVFGQDPNFLDLVTPEYLDARRGSTLSGLMRAAEDARLHAEIIDRGSLRWLRACSHPVILHVRAGDQSRDYSHYVLFMGVDQGQARICDPPEQVALVSFAELASHWDGKGLVLSDEPLDMIHFVWTERARLFLTAGPVVLLILFIHAAQGRYMRSPGWSRPTAKVAVSMAQMGVSALVAFSVALGFHLMGEGGFLVYPDGTASVRHAHATDFLPRIGAPVAEKLLAAKGVFIDARLAPDFTAGHIDGAISIPVDSNDVIRRNALTGVPAHVPLVVYCQSTKCRYAEIVAGKLLADGFSDISIFRGGWLAWIGRTAPEGTSSREFKPGSKWRIRNDGATTPE
jgi:rhodanese-related sulfurtransferase